MVFRAFRVMTLAASLVSAFVSAQAHAQSFGDLVRSTQGRATGSFGSMEIALRPQGGADAPQWRSVVVRMAAERRGLEACLADSRHCTNGGAAEWSAMVRSARGMDRASQLAVVNSFFNKFPYRTDLELYGKSEYWASPAEFLAHSGDCEDYAIAKFFTLKELGFSDRDLKVVAVYDTGRRIGHAILRANLSGQSYVLDNLTPSVMPESRFHNYRALYAMNESGTWVEIPASGSASGLERVASLH